MSLRDLDSPNGEPIIPKTLIPRFLIILKRGSVYRVLVGRVKGHSDQVKVSWLLSLLIRKSIKPIYKELALSAQICIAESTVEFGGSFSVKILSLGTGLRSFESSVVA
jgi:hypothetical protein